MPNDDEEVDDDDGEKVDSSFLDWPVLINKTWSDAGNLRNSLLDSAHHHAHVALRDFTKDSNEMAAAGLHAGIAVEHMAKSYLSSVHPILLAAERCQVDTLLFLVGKGELARSSPYNIKTTGGIEACRRARYLLSEFKSNEQADGLIFSVRNSVGHLGLGADIRKAIRIMVRLIDPLLGVSGWPLWSWILLTASVPAGAVLAAWEIRPARRDGEPVLQVNLLRRRSFALGRALALLYFAGFTSLFFTLSILWQQNA